MGRRLACFLTWLIRDLLTDDVTISHVKRSLIAEGIFTEAEELRRTVCSQLSEKGRNVALVFKVIGVPPEDAALMSLRFPKREPELSAIPSV
jgi:hypothetical protein